MSDDPRIEAVWRAIVGQHPEIHEIEARMTAVAVLEAADRASWRSVDSAPSEGRVWVWGGYTEKDGVKSYFPARVMEADGGWWRVAGLKSVPTHWMPYYEPAPPQEPNE